MSGFDFKVSDFKMNAIRSVGAGFHGAETLAFFPGRGEKAKCSGTDVKEEKDPDDKSKSRPPAKKPPEDTPPSSRPLPEPPPPPPPRDGR